MDLKGRPSQAAVFFTVLTTFPVPVSAWICDRGRCSRGEYVNALCSRGGNCLPCPPGTYMDLDRHDCRDCFSCKEPDAGNHEVVESNCTRDSDTKIVCKEGYFMVNDGDEREKGECHRCTRCSDDQWEMVKCGKYIDTLCCPHISMIVGSLTNGRMACFPVTTQKTPKAGRHKSMNVSAKNLHQRRKRERALSDSGSPNTNHKGGKSLINLQVQMKQSDQGWKGVLLILGVVALVALLLSIYCCCKY